MNYVSLWKMHRSEQITVNEWSMSLEMNLWFMEFISALINENKLNRLNSVLPRENLTINRLSEVIRLPYMWREQLDRPWTAVCVLSYRRATVWRWLISRVFIFQSNILIDWFCIWFWLTKHDQRMISNESGYERYEHLYTVYFWRNQYFNSHWLVWVRLRSWKGCFSSNSIIIVFRITK